VFGAGTVFPVLLIYSLNVDVNVTEVPLPGIGAVLYKPVVTCTLLYEVADATLVISLMVLPLVAGMLNVILMILSVVLEATVGATNVPYKLETVTGISGFVSVIGLKPSFLHAANKIIVAMIAVRLKFLNI